MSLYCESPLGCDRIVKHSDAKSDEIFTWADEKKDLRVRRYKKNGEHRIILCEKCKKLLHRRY